jgi:hypothetical protein
MSERGASEEARIVSAMRESFVLENATTGNQRPVTRTIIGTTG